MPQDPACSGSGRSGSSPSGSSASALLLVAFVNTVRVDTGSDELTDPDGLTGWLAAHQLSTAGQAADGDDLAAARALRAGLRETFAAHHDGRTSDPTELGRAAAGLPMLLGSVDGRLRLRPVDDGVRGALTGIVVAVAESIADGSWDRLKLCVASDCRWGFLDLSRNRSGRWCAMGVCGNRAKTRGYRARKRTEARAGTPSPAP